MARREPLLTGLAFNCQDIPVHSSPFNTSCHPGTSTACFLTRENPKSCLDYMFQPRVSSVNVPPVVTTEGLIATAGIGPPTTSLCHRPLNLDFFFVQSFFFLSFFSQPHFLSGPETSRATKQAPNTTHTISVEMATQGQSSRRCEAEGNGGMS